MKKKKKCDSSTGEAEAGGLRVTGQHGLRGQTLSPKKKSHFLGQRYTNCLTVPLKLK
jgi:hypothetical protein